MVCLGMVYTVAFRREGGGVGGCALSALKASFYAACPGQLDVGEWEVDCQEICVGISGKELQGERFRAQCGGSSADEMAVDCGGCFSDVRLEVHNERWAKKFTLARMIPISFPS